MNRDTITKANKLIEELQGVLGDLSIWQHHIIKPLQLRCGFTGLNIELKGIPDKKSFAAFRAARIRDLARQEKQLKRNIEDL